MQEKIVEIKSYSTEIYQLVRGLLAQLSPKRAPLSEESFRAILDAANTHLFVLYHAEDTPVGMLSVGFCHTPSGHKAWIEDVVVDAAYRGYGYGKKIVEHAIAFIRASEADSISLTTNSSRIAANHLYVLLGFEKYETNVYRMYLP